MPDENHSNTAPNESSPRSRSTPGWLPALLFIPGLITSFAVYCLLRFGRLKGSVIASIAAVIALMVATVMVLGGSLEDFMYAVKNPMDLGKNWRDLVPLYLQLNILGGLPVGCLLVYWEIRQMKRNPHRLELPGSWMHHFQFRRTPLELLQRKKMIDNLRKGAYQSPEAAPLGLRESGEFHVVSRYASEARKHTLVVGGSGSGKTVTLASLMLNDIRAGTPLVIIDLKNSPKLSSKVSVWAAQEGRTFLHFVKGKPEDYDITDSPGQAFYDPLKSGSPTSKADMVLGMREYDTASAVYKANMQQLLQVLFSMLENADRSKAPKIAWDTGGVYQVASAITPGNFSDLAVACAGTEIESEAREIYEQSCGKGSGIRHALEELRGQMRTIVASEYGRWLKTHPDARNIDLFKQTREPGTVILFSLDSDSEPEFARYIGSMIMSDLTSTSARRRSVQEENQVNVYIDEFQAVNPDSVTSLLEKSRESYIAMTLAQQSFEQIIAASDRNGEAYLLSVLDTCSNFIVHAGATHDSAQRLSKILGEEEYTAYRAANKHEGFFLSLNWKNKRNQSIQTYTERRWKFDPSQFMKLSAPVPSNGNRTTAVVVKKTNSDPTVQASGGATAQEVLMIPADDVLVEYYKPTNRSLRESSKPTVPSTVAPASSDENEFVGEDYVQPKPLEDTVIARPRKSVPLDEVEDEDDDGDFEWEEVPDSSESDEDMLSYSSEEPKSTPVSSLRGESTFERIARETKEARGTMNKPSTPAPKRTPKSGGLPIPSSLPQVSPKSAPDSLPLPTPKSD